MTNPFLDEKAAAANNPFMGIDDGIEPTRPGPALVSAQTYQPDAWAQARHRGAALGIAPGVVARNPDEVRKLELSQSLDKVRQTNPRLADWLVSDDNLTLAQDDIEPLDMLGKALYAATNPLAVADEMLGNNQEQPGFLGRLNNARDYAVGRVPGIAGSIAGTIADVSERAGDKLTLMMPEWARGFGDLSDKVIKEQRQVEPLFKLADWLKSFQPQQQEGMTTFEDVKENPLNAPSFIAEQIVTSSPDMAAAVYAMPAYVLGRTGEIATARAQNDGRTEIVGSDYAAALPAAILEATFEKFATGRLLTGSVGGSTARRIAKEVLVQAGTEGAEEGFANIGETVGTERGFSLQQFADAVGAGALVGAGLGGSVEGVKTAFESYADSYTGRAKGSTENQQVDTLSKLVAASKLMERDPAKIRDYVAQAKQAGMTDVFIPGEELTTLFQSSPEAIADFEAAGVLDAAREGVMLAADAKIPLETYLVDIAPKYHAKLGKVARLSPDTITDADPDAQAERDAAAERFLASVLDAPAEGQADMRVYNDVLGQLLGRYNQADAEQMATVVNRFFRDGIGSRAGVDPFELYQRYGLRIVEEVERRVMGRVEPEMDSMFDRLRSGDIPTEADALGPTISEFLAERGIRSAPDEPMAGEIRRIAENDRFSRRGQRRLVREDDQNALTLDYAREAAVEAGFLPEGSDVNDLLDAIENDVRSESNRDLAKSGARDSLLALSDELSRLGLNLDEMSNQEIRQAMQRQADAWMDFDQPAFHGTPHTVDRFSLQKIGSGEGAQAYGWGLYFASMKEVAESYRRGLTKIDKMPGSAAAEEALRKANGSRAEAIRVLSRKGDKQAVEFLRRDPNRGNVYHVEVPEDSDLLDYDKPLSENPPGVRERARNVWDAMPAWWQDEILDRTNAEFDELTGAEFYQVIGKFADDGGMPGIYAHPEAFDRAVGGKEAAAHALFMAGIPGLRYADGNSRGSDAKTYNYVIWDESAISEPTKLFQSAPNIDVSPTTGTRETKIGDTTITYGISKNGETGEVILVSTPESKRGQGSARAAMQQFLQATDRAGVTMFLTAEPMGKGGPKKGALESFYKSLGFRANTGRKADFRSRQAMVRDPQETTLNQSDRAAEAIRRGFLQFGSDRQFTLGLTKARDLSTFLHEFGHFSLEVMGDIAADTDAPQSIREDYAALLKWLGVESREQITTEHHEKFARGFEKYLGEGKAPTPELQSAFTRFKSWMKSIYKSLTALNVELNDEVRGVMARMIAGDEAIVQAEQATVAEPLFKEASRAGMTEAQFAAYLELQAKAHAESEARITAEAYNEVRREQERWWREESARVEDEVRAEFYDLPVYRAWSALQRNTAPDGTPLDTPPVKLSGDWLRDRYGQEFMNKNLLRKQVYSADGGVHGDVIAPVLGFENGAALVEALSNATPLKKAIREETQARMRERHGDMLNDGTLPEKAMRAVHGSRRMKVIEAEIAALARLAGEPAMTAAQARTWAQRQIAGKRVRDITPFQYLRAERKAAREALRAAAADKPVEALAAARRRLANAAMYDEASKARDRFERRSKWIKQQTRKATQERLGKAGVEYRDQVNAILAAAGVRPLSDTEQARQKPLRAFVERLQEQGDDTAVTEAVLSLVESGRPVAMQDMTVEQFTDLHDALRNLKHLALNEGKLLSAADRATVEQAAEAMAARATETHPDRLPEMLSRRDATTATRAADKLRKLASELDRPENIIEALDGGESGPWDRYLWGPMNAAENTAIGLRRRMGTLLRDLRKSMPDGFMRSLNEKVELEGVGEVSRGTLLGIVLNTGNAQNLQRLRDGGIHVNGKPINLTDAQVQALRDLLTPDEARYVQGLWDAVNSLWPDIVALQTEMSGIPPEKVEAQAFTAAGVAMRGGYWPLAYDHSKSNVGERQGDDDALRLMMGQGFSRATTPKGHTKARVENVEAPLQLDFGTVMSRHLENVMTDLAYRKAVKDTSRLLRNQSVKDAIIGRLGKGAYDTLKGSVAYAVSANDLSAQAATSMRHVIAKVVSNSAVSALAIRPDIALGNYGSALIQSLDRVGVRSLLRGLWTLNTGRRDLTAEISRLSPFMAERLGMIDEDYRRELTLAQGKRGYGEAYRRIAMTLHRWADHDVSRAAWWGRYQEALDAGESQAESIRLADKMIRQTQTANARKDVSAIERDPAFRESRTFMGPMFVILGRLRAAAKGEGATRTVGLRAASIMRQMFLAPALFMLLAGRWPEDDDDDGEIGAGEWGTWLAVNTLLFPLQTIPIVREIGSAIEAGATGRPINPRAAPTAQAAAGFVKASKSIIDNISEYGDTGEFDWYDMTRDLTALAGPFTGIPASQTRITTKTIEAIQDDPDLEKTELARMALYGPPKK